MYIRKITRKWKNKNGSSSEKSYYYWYRSIRLGEKVISECLGKATESDYRKLHSERLPFKIEIDDVELERPSIAKVNLDRELERL